MIVYYGNHTYCIGEETLGVRVKLWYWPDVR